MRLYLDTEWAAPEGKQLVSLALANSTDQHRFYCEIDPPLPVPTALVPDTVYALLQTGRRK